VRRARFVVLWYSLVCVQANAASVAPLDTCRQQDARGEREAADGCYRELARRTDDVALRADALRALRDFSGANEAYRAAAARAPNDVELRVRWAKLFADTHQDADAEALLREALELAPDHADARVAYAELLADRFEGRTRVMIDEVLQGEPAHVGANLLAARMNLELGRYDEAIAPLERIAAEGDVDPLARLEAMALLAAADRLTGGSGARWTEAALWQNPRYGDVYAIPAHFFVITRRYAEAVQLLEKAVETDPTLSGARTELGVNLLRLDRFDAASEQLARAYDGDPYDPTVINTLRLLDTLPQYRLIEAPGLRLRVHRSEAEVLAPYAQALFREAMAVFAERYGFVAKEPVVVEMYPQHDDFAVRTAGLPGIGILGATFGRVVAMDSPSARGIGEGFDWPSTLWHELAHVVTLGATDHLVPRWFSEGVSVYEEWRTGPSPRQSVPLLFLEMWGDGRLLAASRLDEGFIRPTYPEQISVSYVQSGLVCELIADSWGHVQLANMLAAYRAGADTDGAITSVLGVRPDEFDAAFRAYIDRRFGKLPERVSEIEALTARARRALDAGVPQDAVTAARAALEVFPENVDGMSPYLVLGRAQQALGNGAAALESYEEYWRLGGRAPEALEPLAAALVGAGRANDAIEVQRQLARLVPLEPRHHTTLGDLYRDAGRHEEAAGEYRMLLALAPHDRASAHYRLALAYRELGRMRDAQHETVLSLEVAPRYAPALALLLELTQASTDPSTDPSTERSNKPSTEPPAR